MTSREFTESMAFDRLEPDPAEVSTRLLAELLTLMWNVNRDRKKHPREFAVTDFLPNPFAPPVAEQRAVASHAMATFEAHYQKAKRQN